MKSLFLICFMASLCLGQGCKRGSQASLKNQPTEIEVGEILVQGKPKAEVDRIFGAPIFHQDMRDGKVMAVYNLLSDNRAIAWEHRFSGFQAYYDENNRLVKWTPNYSTSTVSDSTNVPLSVRNSLQRLQFYIVSESELTPGKFIDTAKFPKLGYIAEEPAFQIAHIESLKEETSTDSKGEKQEGIIIAFSKEEAIGLENLTRKNIGKKVLIIIDGDPVAAPWIMEPITGGIVQISGLTKAEIQKFVGQK